MATAFSDLVRDLELETEVFPDHVCHYFNQRGTSGSNRRVRVTEQWTRHKQLGRGAYASVWLEKTASTSRRTTTMLVRAVKEIKVDPDVDYYRELEAIVKFSHNRYEPCFVQCFGWYQHSQHIYITMEYLQHGDLKRHIRSPLPEVEVSLIIRQVVDGLVYMHGNNFVHRDLKPENILVASLGPDWLVQISDFGISKRLEEGRTMRGTMQQGTLGYVAPEMMGLVPEKSCQQFPADMWSLGALAFRMLSGKPFLPDLKELRAFVTGEKPSPCEELVGTGLLESCLDFLGCLLVTEPSSRMTVTDAHNHIWIATLGESSLPTALIRDLTTKSDGQIHETMRQSEASTEWTWQTSIAKRGNTASQVTLNSSHTNAETKEIMLWTQQGGQDKPQEGNRISSSPLGSSPTGSKQPHCQQSFGVLHNPKIPNYGPSQNNWRGPTVSSKTLQCIPEDIRQTYTPPAITSQHTEPTGTCSSPPLQRKSGDALLALEEIPQKRQHLRRSHSEDSPLYRPAHDANRQCWKCRHLPYRGEADFENMLFPCCQVDWRCKLLICGRCLTDTAHAFLSQYWAAWDANVLWPDSQYRHVGSFKKTEAILASSPRCQNHHLIKFSQSARSAIQRSTKSTLKSQWLKVEFAYTRISAVVDFDYYSSRCSKCRDLHRTKAGTRLKETYGSGAAWLFCQTCLEKFCVFCLRRLSEHCSSTDRWGSSCEVEACVADIVSRWDRRGRYQPQPETLRVCWEQPLDLYEQPAQSSQSLAAPARDYMRRGQEPRARHPSRGRDVHNHTLCRSTSPRSRYKPSTRSHSPGKRYIAGVR